MMKSRTRPAKAVGHESVVKALLWAIIPIAMGLASLLLAATVPAYHSLAPVDDALQIVSP